MLVTKKAIAKREREEEGHLPPFPFPVLSSSWPLLFLLLIFSSAGVGLAISETSMESTSELSLVPI